MTPEFEDAALNELMRTMTRVRANNALFTGGNPQDRSALIQGLAAKMNKAGEAGPPAVLEISGDRASLEMFLASPPGTKAFVTTDMNDVMADPQTEHLVKVALERGGLMGFATMTRAVFQDPGVQRRLNPINLTP